MPEIILLCILFFIISMVYSSAGFGGGSSYLAVLSLFSMPFVDIRIIALICNIVVVSSSVFLFHKHQLINWRKVIPLVLFSVPLAYLGGRFLIDEKHFFILLALSLLVSSIFMFIDKRTQLIKLPKFANAFIGSSIGFLSGLVGIGGGIFLSPILHISKWDTSKSIASASAFFILVNSLAGIIGQLNTYGGQINWDNMLPLILAVFIGGQIGVRTTILAFNPQTVKRITAGVILFVAIRILAKYLF